MQKTIKQFKTYVDAFNDYKNPHELTKADFRKILYAFNWLLAASTVTEGKVYKIPYNVGFLGVYKRQTVGKGHFDYQYWKETGEKRFIKNKHSGNYVAQVLWRMEFPVCSLFSYSRNLFKFKAVRDYNRFLASKIKEDNTINLYHDK